MKDQNLNTDKRLLQGLKENSEECFNEVYHRYGIVLFEKAEAVLGDQSLAEDCLQDVFMDLWKRRHQVEIEHLASYLKNSVRYKAIDMIRRKKLYRNYTSRIAAITTQLFSQQPVFYRELMAIFQSTLEALPEDQRQIFMLAREQGLTYSEIAELRGISVKTVEKKMSSSLQSLRLKLGEFLTVFL